MVLPERKHTKVKDGLTTQNKTHQKLFHENNKTKGKNNNMKNEIKQAYLDDLRNTNFGVEIEFSCMSQEHCARIVADVIGGEIDGDDGIIAPDGRVWEIHNDGSVNYHGEGCGELVTPKLKYDDIETLQKILRQMRAEGAKSNSSYGCGVHIHVDSKLSKDGDGHYTVVNENSLKPKHFKNVMNIAHVWYGLLSNSIDIASSRRGWCNDFTREFLTTLNTSRLYDMDDIYNIWYTSMNTAGHNGSYRDRSYHYNDTRYHIVNLHSTYNRGSIEFRCFEFHKNIHAGEMKAYIQLCLAIVTYAKYVNRVKFRPVSAENQKYAVKTWLNNLCLKGDEFKTCRAMLTKRLVGDTAYKNGRPVADNIDDLAIE